MRSEFELRVEALIRETVQRALAFPGAETPSAPPPESPAALFHSPRAQDLKREIVHTGRKLWTRAYVDGNGGNISARLTERYILCTPTLISKGDLAVEDLCLVDLDNALVCGHRSQTSEILLHLAIYKRLPQARAVVHCHPPYATAHAIAGVAPPEILLPEQEVFVGPVPVVPFQAPGTEAFAKSILPFVEKHSTLLLANHGIVSWSDTVTHAEWAVEVLETYCKTAHLARQLNPSPPTLPAAAVARLLRVKYQLGIPDPRFREQPRALAIDSPAQAPAAGDAREQLIAALTSQLLAHLDPSRSR